MLRLRGLIWGIFVMQLGDVWQLMSCVAWLFACLELDTFIQARLGPVAVPQVSQQEAK